MDGGVALFTVVAMAIELSGELWSIAGIMRDLRGNNNGRTKAASS
jgi:hypothetical protein